MSQFQAQHTALIVAGGTGTRMGTEVPKQLLLLGDAPILVHSIRNFLDFDPKTQICLVLHGSIIPVWEELSRKYFDYAQTKQIHTCEGGLERTISVYNGLKKLAEVCGISGEEDNNLTEVNNPLVAIHDGVRPFARPDMLKKAFKLATEKGNAVICVPVKSSMRKKTETGSMAVDRTEYFNVQTPQIFYLRALLSCYKKRPNDLFTDDASLMEYFEHKIQIAEGSYDNLKITTPEDLSVAEMILARLKFA